MDTQTILIFSGSAFAAMNVLLLLALFWYAKSTDAAIKDALSILLEQVDAFADSWDNPASKALIVMQVRELLGWRRVFLPTVVLTWAIGGEIKIIRKLQALTGCPDLHKGGSTSGTDNAGPGTLGQP